MKKKLMILFVGILLVGLVVGGVGIFAVDEEISFDKISLEEKVYLETKGVGNWSINDLKFNEKYERDLISRSDYNLPKVRVKSYYMNCSEYGIEIVNWTSDELLLEFEEGKDLITSVNHSEEIQGDCINFERINYTSEEMNMKMEDAMVEKMKQIAGAIKIRATKSEGILINEGDVVIGK